MNETLKLAFAKTMYWEVGPFFNANDPETIQGLCNTSQQRRKVGYVNDPADSGGETKFGVAKNANRSVNIKTLTLDGAIRIYQKNYWETGKCDKLPSTLAVLHFDACTNHGTKQAAKFLQRAIGVTDDGIIGNITLSKINSLTLVQQKAAAVAYLANREKFFRDLVARRPKDNRFLKGWLARVDYFRTWVSAI